MKRNLIPILLAGILLSACNQDDQLVGKWYGPQASLNLRKDGTGTIIKEGKTTDVKWSRQTGALVLNRGGEDIFCGLVTFKNHMKLVKQNSAGPQNCDITSIYWHLDMPESAKVKSLHSFICTSNGQSVYKPPLSAEFVIDADKEDGLACFGRVGDTCRIVWDAQNVSDTSFDMDIRWENNTAVSYSLNPNSDGSGLMLTEAVTSDCNENSCSYSTRGPVIATCTKK